MDHLGDYRNLITLITLAFVSWVLVATLLWRGRPLNGLGRAMVRFFAVKGFFWSHWAVNFALTGGFMTDWSVWVYCALFVTTGPWMAYRIITATVVHEDELDAICRERCGELSATGQIPKRVT